MHVCMGQQAETIAQHDTKAGNRTAQRRIGVSFN
jgi:hypothetical protein